MELAEFVGAQRPKWQALEQLLDRAEIGGLRALSLSDARAFAKLYRSASSDLLWVRARSSDVDVSGYLTQLVGRAYALTYPGRQFRWGDVSNFILREFPEVFLREWRIYLASALIFLAGGAFGYIGMIVDPNAAVYLVPGDHQSIDPVERARREAESPGAPADAQVAFSSFLFTHNISVAFGAFALGLTGGIGTVILLFINGLMLGALAWVYDQKDMTGWFWAWILPHGIPELTAICIAGAAGLILGRAMIAPRGLARAVALRAEALTAIKVLFGTLVLFILAGCIEGTISQIHPPHLSVEFKIGFALVVGAGVYAYLFSASLRGHRAPELTPQK